MTAKLTDLQQIATKIDWITNACVKFTLNGRTIYIDPWKLKRPDHADLILITHDHYDHFSPDDIALIVDATTDLVCTADVAQKAKSLGLNHITTVAPFSTITWNAVKISTVPMYNVVKDNFHNKKSGWVGYIVEFDGVRLYHAGDTERIAEMRQVNCDIVLMPIGQTYTMNSVDEAAQAIIDTGAKIAIPIHFDVHESQPGDAQKLKSLLMGKVEVMIKIPQNSL